MILLEKVQSKVDKVVKYVFRLHPESNDIVEFSYIDNNTGKDIVCVSCQTMCSQGCTFCHCTDYIGKVPVKSLIRNQIVSGVRQIISDLETKHDTLLVSYMGCGEPLATLFENEVIRSMEDIRQIYKDKYNAVRFALATSFPEDKASRFFVMTETIKRSNLKVKLHLSLHYPTNGVREQWMPNSLHIQAAMSACRFYKAYTNNNVEIHYTLIRGVNDSKYDAENLNELVQGTGFNVKIITYNEKDTINYKRSDKVDEFVSLIKVPIEVYTPPGRDVGSSCGQFLFGTYEKWKLNDRNDSNNPDNIICNSTTN